MSDKPPFYATAQFAILTATVVVLMFLISVIVLIFVLPLNTEGRTAAIASITGFAAPVIAVLVLLLRQQWNIDALNSHLNQHVQLTEDVTKAINGGGQSNA